MIMKNEAMIAAWDSILPDAESDKRMLSNIMAYQQQFDGRARTIRMARFLPIAASLACAIAVTAFWGVRHNWFGMKEYAVKVADGEQIVYTEHDPEESQLAADSIIAPYPVTSRDLTADEIRMLFPELEQLPDDYAFGHFKDETGELVRMEGKIGGIRICAANADLSVTDTVIAGQEAVSVLCGIPVKTVYTVMRPNSKGVRTAIFCAEFTVGGVHVYTELAGDERNGRQLSEQLSEVVYSMITTGSPDFSAIRL